MSKAGRKIASPPKRVPFVDAAFDDMNTKVNWLKSKEDCGVWGVYSAAALLCEAKDDDNGDGGGGGVVSAVEEEVALVANEDHEHLIKLCLESAEEPSEDFIKKLMQQDFDELTVNDLENKDKENSALDANEDDFVSLNELFEKSDVHARITSTALPSKASETTRRLNQPWPQRKMNYPWEQKELNYLLPEKELKQKPAVTAKRRRQRREKWLAAKSLKVEDEETEEDIVFDVFKRDIVEGKEIKFRCRRPGCGMLLDGGKERNRHEGNHGWTMLACPTCRRKFAGPFSRARRLLREHMLIVHMNREKVRCKDCQREFKPLGLMSHRLNCKGVVMEKKKVEKLKQNVCDVCRKSFKYRLHLEKHKLTHTVDNEGEVRKNPGRVVLKRLTSKVIKKFTTLVVNAPLSPVRKHCKKTFKKTDTWKNHEKNCRFRMAGKKKKNEEDQNDYDDNGGGIEDWTWFDCPTCQKRFSGRHPLVALRVHMAMHARRWAHACDKCGCCFPSASNLYLHGQNHPVIMPGSKAAVVAVLLPRKVK